ncbi:hypothetical protein FJ365_03230 [Candidatus Dependentiae bacterium]|nr:hypothetical protein [Candidatus Dependentiae bacterium]
MENKLYVVLGIVLLLGLAARPLKADELAELEKQAAGGTSFFSRFSNWFGSTPAPTEESTEEAVRPQASSFQLSVGSTADIAPVPLPAPAPVVVPVVAATPTSTAVVVQQPVSTPAAAMPSSNTKPQESAPKEMVQKTPAPRIGQAVTLSTSSRDVMAGEAEDVAFDEESYYDDAEQSYPKDYTAGKTISEGTEEAFFAEYPEEMSEPYQSQDMPEEEAEYYSSQVDSRAAIGGRVTAGEDVWYEEEMSDDDVAAWGDESEPAAGNSKVNIGAGARINRGQAKIKPGKLAAEPLAEDEDYYYEEFYHDSDDSLPAEDGDEYVEIEEEIEIPDEEEAPVAAVATAGVKAKKAGDAKNELKLLAVQPSVLKDAAPGAKGLKQQAKKGKKKIIKRKRWLMRKKGMLKRKAMRQRRLLKQAAKAGTIGKKLAVKKNLVVAKKPIVSKKPMPSKKVINVKKSGKGKKIILRRRRLIRKKRALKKVPKSLPQRKSSTAAVPVAQKQGEAGQKPAVENKVSGTETSALAKVPTVLPVKTVVAPKTARKAAKPVRKQKKQPIKLARLKARKRAAAKKQQQKKVAARKALAQPAPISVPAPTTPVAATEIAKPAPVAGPAVKKTGKSK